MRPILHHGVREGLTRIKYLRVAVIALVLAWPAVGIVAFEIGLPLFAVFLVCGVCWTMLWAVLIWSRCPRCERFFFPSVTPFLFPAIAMFRRRCCECGLDIRQLKR